MPKPRAARQAGEESSDSDSVDLESTEESEADEGKDYVVECILAEDQDVEGKMFYLLKWEGYPLLRSTWEPAENIKGQSTFDEWEAQKARIERGLAKPFDVEKFEEELNEENEAKALRKKRREVKRKRLGLAKSFSARERENRHPPMEQIDSDSSSEAQEVNEDLEDAPGIPAPALRPPQRSAVSRAPISEDIGGQDESLGETISTRQRPRRRHNIPDRVNDINDDSLVEELGKQDKERKALRKTKATVRKIPETTLDDTLHESESLSSRSPSPQRPLQNLAQQRKRLGAEAPSRTGYLGTANRVTNLSSASSRGRGAAATRGLRRGWRSGRTTGGAINFTAGSTATSAALQRPRGLATAILNASKADSNKSKQHFMTPSMVRKAELATRSLADRVPDIAHAGPLIKPSEYNGSRPRKKSIPFKLDESRKVSDVTQNLHEGQSMVRKSSADAEPFQLVADDENDVNQGVFVRQDTEMRDLPSWTPTGPRAMQQEQFKMTAPTSVSTSIHSENLEASGSIPIFPKGISSNAPQQSAQLSKPVTKVTFNEYRSRRVWESFGDAILIQAIFGDKEASPIFVAFKQTDKNCQDLWVRALNGLGTVSLTQICVAQDFQAQICYSQSNVLASGDIATDSSGSQILEKVAERLRPLSGLVFKHQLFNILIYPAKCEEWKFIDVNANTDSDALILYRIFQGPTDVTSETSSDVFRDMASFKDLNGNYLQSLLNLTQSLQYGRLVPNQKGANNAHNFYLLFPSKAIHTANFFGKWLRMCDPECQIYTNEKAGSWNFFSDNPNFNVGTVLIHQSLLAFVYKIPHLAEMMEVRRQFTFWCFGDSPSADLVQTSLGCPMIQLFPHGGAIFLTPSFLRSQPKRTYDLLIWFQEKVAKATPGTWKLVVAHNCCEYLLDMALRRASAGEGSYDNSMPEHNSKDDNAASKGSSHCLGKFEFLNYRILDKLMRQELMARDPFNWDKGADEVESSIVYADESLDPDDEKGLATWFALWSMLRLHLFRKFVVVGTGLSRARPKTLKNETARLKPKFREELLGSASDSGADPVNSPGQGLGNETSTNNRNAPAPPEKRWKRNSSTAVNDSSMSDLPHSHASRKTSTKLPSNTDQSNSIGTNVDESILYFIAITGSDKETASHWVEKFNNDAITAVKLYAREQHGMMQLDGTEYETDPSAILNFAGSYASGPDAPIIPSIAHEDLRRAMELYNIAHGRSRSPSTGPQNFDGTNDMDAEPRNRPPSTSGIVTDADGIRRFVPSSIRPSGTIRPEINVRPGYVPSEDKEVYRNRRIVGGNPRYEHEEMIHKGSGSKSSSAVQSPAREVTNPSMLHKADTAPENDDPVKPPEGNEEVPRHSVPEVVGRNSEVEELQTPTDGQNLDIGETTVEWYGRLYKEGKGWEHIYVKDWETCFKTMRIPIKSQ